MKLHYVYLTTNLITGQQYVGDHSINETERYFYLGSGYEIIDAIKKYKRNNFFKEILEWFETREEACKSQEKYIRLFKTHITQGGYNKSWTGGTHCGGRCSEETIKLMKQNSIGKNVGKTRTEEFKLHHSLCMIGNTNMKGKHHSIETREKIKLALTKRKFN